MQHPEPVNRTDDRLGRVSIKDPADQQAMRVAGRFAAEEASGRPPSLPPPETAHGALLAHITGGAVADSFQPMNVNFGLFPPLPASMGKQERKPAMARRALEALEAWLAAGGKPAIGACQSRENG